MMRNVIACAVCILGGTALASAGMAASPVAENTPLGSGPFRAVLEVDPGLPTHTLYHPADLAASGPLPVVLWGNGACANAGDRFRWFLSDIASYGYLIIAVGPIQNKAVWPAQVMTPFAAGGTPVIRPGVTVAASTPATHSAQLLDALHWAVAENERTSSRFYHRLRVNAVAAMGQSCGGAQALEIVLLADPHIRTTIMWNSGPVSPAPPPWRAARHSPRIACGSCMGRSPTSVATKRTLRSPTPMMTFPDSPDIPVFRAYRKPAESCTRAPIQNATAANLPALPSLGSTGSSKATAAQAACSSGRTVDYA